MQKLATVCNQQCLQRSQRAEKKPIEMGTAYRPHMIIKSAIYDARDTRQPTKYESAAKLRRWMAAEEQAIDQKIRGKAI